MWDWLRQTFIDPAARAEPGGSLPRAETDAPRPEERRSSSAHPPGLVPVPLSRQPAAMPTIRRVEPPHRLRQVDLPSPGDVADCEAVAVDFETANASRASPCAVGLAWLRGGEIAHRAYRLVRPPGNRFDVGSIRVHGLHPGDVEHQPEFPAIWSALAPLLHGRLLLAHNATFDTGVLVSSLQTYGLKVPELRTACTLAVARRAWTGLPRHGLPDVAAHLGIQLRHHHALEDAEASATIALSAARMLGLASVAGLVEALRSTRQWPQPTARPIVGIQAPPRQRPAPRDDADPSHPLHGRTLVVTGLLRSMTRDEVLQAIAKVGGRTVATVSPRVDYLVVGAEPGPTKLSRARELRSAGCDLLVIDEARLMHLLGPAAA